MKEINVKGKEICNKIKENFFKRYVFLILLFIAILGFGLFSKDITYTKNYGKENKILLLDDELSQSIDINNKEIKNISFKIGKNEPKEGSKYKISVLDNETVIATKEVNTKELNEQDTISLDIPSDRDIKGGSLLVNIKGDCDKISEGMFVYVYHDSEAILTVGNTDENFVMQNTIGYLGYSSSYVILLICLFIITSIVILLFDLKSIHNSIFAIILLAGFSICILNPILDTPDDHAHLCRAELTSRGILYLSKETSEYNISNSVKRIIDNNFMPIGDSEIVHDTMDLSYTSNYNNYANTNLFIGYIPQAIGVLVASTLGRIFNISSVFILLFGRMCNLIFYAIIVRYAIKKTPIFKIPIAVIALMPMSLFIATSFNPDTTTYGLVFLLISYFLYLYNKENIEVKDIAKFAILSIIIGLVKLPCCIFGGLIIFLPISKFKTKKTYYISFLFVALVAIVCVMWGMFAMIMSSGDSPFTKFYTDNNISTPKQIAYILSAPLTFAKNFLRALANNLHVYIKQLSIFGWLSYSMNNYAFIFYCVIIGSIMIIYPNEEVLCKKTKLGIVIVVFCIYAITCLILYLSWTPVASPSIDGVQGRYFIPIISAMPLLSILKCDKIKERKQSVDLSVACFAIIFLNIFIITILNKYY